MKRPLLAALVAASATAAAPGAADAALYLTIDGIQGESTNTKFKGAIEVSSYQVGFGLQAGQGNAAVRQSLACSEVTLTKDLDKASPVLLEGVARGTRYKEAEISFVSNDITYFKVRLTDVGIPSMGQSSGGDRPTESLSLDYAVANFQYSQVEDGKVKGVVERTITCPR